MYIKSVSIDGFKSYGRKVELFNFDKSFNAITGLNGTGKSNILDAICFVLGSNNTTLARVNNLKELIYKNGTAGVLKANVIITFDNKDQSCSPPSFEKHEEIIVRREVSLHRPSKYYINGLHANTQEVVDLFHSVQLNINNPHFLIMQGRITKVLNMKPQEILAMVEEATGASRYEVKKKQSEDRMNKKEQALKAIETLLNEQIGANLKKLKEQSAGLQEYKSVSLEVEHLTKVLTAWKFVSLQESCSETDSKIADKQNEIQNLQNDITSSLETVAELTALMSSLEAEKDKEFGGKLAKLEESLKATLTEETKATGQWNNAKDNLKDISKKKKNLETQRDNDNKNLALREKEFNKLTDGFDQLDKEFKEDSDALTKAQRDFEAISAGASRSDDGDATKTLAEQLFNAKSEAAQLETDNTINGNKITHLQKEVQELKKKMGSRRDSAIDDKANCQRLEAEVAKLQQKIDSVGFDEATYSENHRKRKELVSEVNGLSREVENIEHKSRVGFNYRNPGQGFDASNVRGMVCQLIKVKNPQDALALEVTAGSRLYNVVVRDQHTAKLLLERGQLQHSTTFLPLDRIQGKRMDANKIRNAERLVGKENVASALNLIEYDRDLEETMRYVFGNTLICRDMDTAKTLAYNPTVKCRSVTLDGEDFSPEGTLTGGSQNNRQHVLQEMSRLREVQADLSDKQRQLSEVEDYLRHLDQLKKSYIESRRSYDLKLHELDLLKKSLENSNSFMLQEELKTKEKELESFQEFKTSYPEKKKKLLEKIKELENKMKNSKSLRANELKEAEATLKKAQAKCNASSKTMSKKKQERETLQLVIEEIRQEIDKLECEIAATNAEIEEAEGKVKEAKSEVDEIGQKVEELRESVAAQKKKLKTKSDEINKLLKKKDQTVKEADTKKLEIRKLEHQIEQIETQSAEASRTLKQLLRNNPWIEEEKRDFGNEKAGYPFKATTFDPKRIQAKLGQLQERKTVLAKTVNMRANVALQDKEKEYDDVTQKKKQLESDKEKLKEYMKKMDLERKEILQTAYVKINDHFSEIFKSLLPGADANLREPPGKTIHDGLEVKVSFGGVWKESLTELSGGQRSLVALSLILALLRYNPAPIYILDEVDAALDQNHTTNIGQMIKANFPDSQFIIVSLKDDMFNNANVLFKTRFIDGSSAVIRQERSSR